MQTGRLARRRPRGLPKRRSRQKRRKPRAQRLKKVTTREEARTVLEQTRKARTSPRDVR